jgi:hypothetical protein
MDPRGISGDVDRAGVAPGGNCGGGGGELYTCFDGRSQPTETNDNNTAVAFQRMS